MDLDRFLLAISFAAIPVLFAITLHEVAHGWAARHFGDRTAEVNGRLSLNPLKHIDPFGTVILPALLLLSGTGILFGWAKPVPVDARNLRHPKRDMAWIAAAGPGVNLAMAVAWGLVLGVTMSGWFGDATVASWLLEMSKVGISFNVLLAIFNLIPLPPLDGGRILVSTLPPGPSLALERIERFVIVGLLALIVLPQLVGAPNVLGQLLWPPVQFVTNAIVRLFT